MRGRGGGEGGRGGGAGAGCNVLGRTFAGEDKGGEPMEVAADMVDSHYFIRFNTEAVLDHPRISVIRIHGTMVMVVGESSNGMGGG